jgi:hypothetical protein
MMLGDGAPDGGRERVGGAVIDTAPPDTMTDSYGKTVT